MLEKIRESHHPIGKVLSNPLQSKEWSLSSISPLERPNSKNMEHNTPQILVQLI